MSGTLRHRLTATTLLAAVGGVLVATGAGAAPMGTEVTFKGGGLLGAGLLVCTSEPDKGRLSVRAETTVTFVNHTGQQATLRVDGQDAGAVGANQAVPVMFHRGPVTVSLIPKCGLNLNQQFGSVNVEVTAVSEARPSPTPSERRSPAGAAPNGRAPAGQRPIGRASAGAALPGQASASTLPGGTDLVPGSSSDMSDVGVKTNAGNVAVSAPIPATPAPAGANGLLALVAAVFIIGVGSGAIRAILAQRATRASVA